VAMTKLENIQKVITELSAEFSATDFEKLRTFIDELEADLWDAEIERDAKAGKLDKLIAQALANYAAGNVEDL
jgi:hypothetical protein